MKKIKLSKEDYELLKEKLCDLSNTEAMVKLKDLFEEEKDYTEIPFDFDKAKNELPVMTKSGEEVRIICWDKLGDHPIVGLIKRNSEKENAVVFDKFGIPVNSPVEVDSLVCVVEKRRVWVSIYLDENGYIRAAIPNEVDPYYKILDTVQVSYFPK